jgi:hypothetical protein
VKLATFKKKQPKIRLPLSFFPCGDATSRKLMFVATIQDSATGPRPLCPNNARVPVTVSRETMHFDKWTFTLPTWAIKLLKKLKAASFSAATCSRSGDDLLLHIENHSVAS